MQPTFQLFALTVIVNVVLADRGVNELYKDGPHAKNSITAEKTEYRSTVWGFWSEWSECSRTCGGGSSYTIKECNIGYEKWCHQHFTRKYRTCNNHDCPNSEIDYRAHQCRTYNAVPHDGKFFTWIPVKPDEKENTDLCALLCRATEDESLVVQWAPSVLDGTRCTDDNSPNMCIAGECQVVGCDRVLHSAAKLDVCGVCGGDGSSCKLHTGIYLPDDKKRIGSEHIITVPTGSRHILFTEKGYGHLSIKIGNHSVNASSLSESNPLRISDIMVEYGTTDYGKEYLNIKGPLPSDMHFIVTYGDSDWKYVRYEYYHPLLFKWSYGINVMTPCSVSCGGGVRFIRPRCLDVETGKFVNKTKCQEEDLLEPEPKVEHCNIHDCLSR